MRNFGSLLALSTALLMTACSSAEVETSPTSKAETAQTAMTALPALKDYIACLPQETALVAAHRGSAYDTQYPENSMSALKALLEKGFLVSEIDVAGLKDGMHILYHDGVWDEKSTGKGPIASTTWEDAQKILLKDTNGDFSADRPVKFEDYILAVKGKMYLEVDFKSSSNYETVIELLRKHDMADQVILISYNEGQTKKLSSLAPEMMLSVGSREALGQTRFGPDQVAAWVGYRVDDMGLIQALRDKDIPILGRVRKDWGLQAADAADLLVTDNVFDHQPIAGLTDANRGKLESCLAKL